MDNNNNNNNNNNNKSKYMIKIALEATAICATCYAFDYVWHNQYCNLIFQCGCTWPWAGGSKYCNIHNPNGPHCPWYVHIYTIFLQS